MRAVTIAEPDPCDPLIIQKALALMTEDLDHDVGATLSREREYRFPG